MNTPTVIIRETPDGKYQWVLCLSENENRPSCKSPNDYVKLIECRQSAMRFCKHLTVKIKVKGCEDVTLVDQVGDQRKCRVKKEDNV